MFEIPIIDDTLDEINDRIYEKRLQRLKKKGIPDKQINKISEDFFRKTRDVVLDNAIKYVRNHIDSSYENKVCLRFNLTKYNSFLRRDFLSDTITNFYNSEETYELGFLKAVFCSPAVSMLFSYYVGEEFERLGYDVVYREEPISEYDIDFECWMIVVREKE